MRILILGGTSEAREIAGVLQSDFDVITSLAGVTSSPLLPPGKIRRGGFGGAEGLADYARREKISVIIDATHPFAAQMSRHAASAGVPCFRFERPAWPLKPGWISVATTLAALECLPPSARAFVTIGRKEIEPFFARADISGIARMIEPPSSAVPPHWHLILARPPFTVASERQLMADHGITHLVAKNAGGGQTQAKLVAAAESNVQVLMVARPLKAPVPTFATLQQLRKMLSP